MTAVVIILPIVRVERYDRGGAIDLSSAAEDLQRRDRAASSQQLLPSSDRRNVVELDRVRGQRRDHDHD